MSTIVTPPEQELPASPKTHQAFRVSFKGTLVFVAIILAMAAAAALVHFQQQPWVEILGKDLLRTNAPSRTLASARDAVIDKHQNWVLTEEGKRSDPSYQGGARVWSVGALPDETRMKVVRGKTQITNKDAATLSIESISATDTPTLVFIDHDNPTEKLGIVNDLVNELVKKGVKVRE